MSLRVVRAYGALCDAGPQRPINEDAYIAVPERQLFGVADGFGGQGAGPEAAKKCLADVKFFVENGLGDSEVTLPFVYRSYYTAGANLLFNAFLHANEQLFFDNQKKNINTRGGASALFVFFEGKHMTLANVGSNHAVLVRKGRVQGLIKPRSYNASRGVFAGSWNPKWAFPLMALGQAKDLEPELMELSVERGDVILLSTDGIYPYLTEADYSECYSILNSRDAVDIAIQKQNQRLMQIGQQKGNLDNSTVITLVCE